MKAIVQDGYGSPDSLKLREIDKPVLGGDDHVLLRVSVASLNALDWGLMRRLPHVVGKLLRLPWGGVTTSCSMSVRTDPSPIAGASRPRKGQS